MQNVQQASKQSSTSTPTPSNQDTLQNKFVVISKLALQPQKLVDNKERTTIDPFALPVGPNLAHLTPTERIFKLGTNVESRGLTIKTDEEFYLFMEMRAKRQWASSRMTSLNWVTETADYNKELKAVARTRNSNQPPPVDKHSSALINKLSAVEIAISKRLSVPESPDYKSKPIIPSRYLSF